MSGEKLTSKKLVIGASGFLGSHVTRQLVERGDDVRVMLRKTSSTRGIDDLDVERVYGDVFDDQALQTAMVDCDVVYYCVVDARAWLRDPSPLFRTNVEGLRHVLDAACEANLKRFVFTSTIATLAIGDGSPVTEANRFDWHGGGPYVVQAAIAALHADEPRDWPQIAALYGELARITGSPVVELSRAVAVAETEGPQAGLDIADRLELEDYRYLHATRGELLRRLGRADEARRAYRRALALAHDDAERRLLERRLAELG